MTEQEKGVMWRFGKRLLFFFGCVFIGGFVGRITRSIQLDAGTTIGMLLFLLTLTNAWFNTVMWWFEWP